MNSSSTLPHLQELASQIKDLGQKLDRASAELGEENVVFVVATSVELQEFVNALGKDPACPDPLESRIMRHDLRNKVSVIKGFSDLMRMDVFPGSPWEAHLDRLIALSDEFVEHLNQFRDSSPADCGAAIFA